MVKDGKILREPGRVSDLEKGDCFSATVPGTAVRPSLNSTLLKP